MDFCGTVSIGKRCFFFVCFLLLLLFVFFLFFLGGGTRLFNIFFANRHSPLSPSLMVQNKPLPGDMRYFSLLP